VVLATLIEVAAVLGLHLLLLHLMAHLGTVATLLAAGPHVPAGSLLLAIAFVLIRLLAVLVLPGFVLYRLVQLGFSLRARSRAKM
jgi:hypothetical protein